MSVQQADLLVRVRNTVRTGVFAVCAILLSCWALPAQQVTGRITGTVVDSTGGAVPNAQINITNQDTGATRTAVAAADGLYNVPQVQAGKYTVEVSAQGFGRKEVKNVEVTVATDTRIDLKLEVGSLTQAVTVSEAAPLVDTTSSTLGGVVDEQRVADLPLNGRNWADLSLMQAGVTQAKIFQGNAAIVGTNGLIFSVNGGTLRSNFYSLDGANMSTLSGFNATSSVNSTLGADGIKEYKVVTSNFSAEYGMRMGSQTTIVSKGGTNAFHGDVFEYIRNSALDARDYFDALDAAIPGFPNGFNGLGTDKSLPFPGKRLPPFQRNNFGAAFGGPIRKDKTFFWAVYEGLRSRKGTPIQSKTLPAACFIDQNGVTQTKVPALIQNTAGACASGTGSTSPISVNSFILPFAQLFPFPNVNASALPFTYTFPYIQPTREDYGQIRVDHNFSSSNTGFVRFTADNADATPVLGFPGFVNPLHSNAYYATIGEDHVFSPTLLNSFKFSYSRTVGFNNPTALDPALSNSKYILVPNNIFPAITPASTVSSLGTQGSVTSAYQDIFTYADDVFWTKGKHAFKFGTLINHFFQYPNSHFNFQGTVTFGSLVNFFNGVYSNFTVTLPNSQTGLQVRDASFGVYAQDDYRLNSRVTLNLGLRYEFITVPLERVPALRSVVRSPLDAAGTPGPYFLNNSLKNFSPRVGFAWDLAGNGKTSLKGGAGIYYDLGAIANSLGVMGISNPPISTNYQILNSTSAVNPPTIPAFTTPFVFGPNSTIAAPRAPEYDLQQPTLAQYNLTIQHEFPWAVAVNVSYIGSRAWHLMEIREGNPTTPLGIAANGYPYQCAVALVNGLCNSSATPTARANTAGPVVNGVLTSAWGSFQLNQARGDSYYNSLQTQLNKRLGNGLQFQLTYTYSKLLDTGQGQLSAESVTEANQFTNNVDQKQDKGPATFDSTHNVRANFIYHLPDFKTNGFVGKLTNGWWISSIVAAQTGYPFNPTLGSDRALTGSTYRTLRPNFASTYNPATVITGKIGQWFDPTMFSLPPAGQYGNVGRDLLRGPGFSGVDFSLVKDTKVGFLGEAGSVQFRTEVFNILNHPAFGMPSSSIWTSSAVATLPAGGQILSAGTTCAVAPTAACVTGAAGTSVSPLATLATAGQISNTVSNARQIQFALKVIF